LGELLDLFFARLLPSGTGDFGIGPSQLREKQTNPIMVCTLSFDGAFFYFNSLTVSCWTYFLPGFYRAVPVISASALLSLGKSKRTLMYIALHQLQVLLYSDFALLSIKLCI